MVRPAVVVDLWWQRSACRGDAFAPFGSDAEQRSFVRNVCVRCPVIAQCLEDGRGHPGAWGGMTERERLEAGMFREWRAG